MKKLFMKKTLKYNAFMLFTIFAIVLDIVVVGISYYVYTSNLKEECARLCTGISQAIAATVNGNRINDWLKDERLEEYEKTEERFGDLMKSFSDIESIRVYKMNTDGMQVIFNIKKGDMNNDSLGVTQNYSEEFEDIKYRLIHGEAVEPVYIDNGNGRRVIAFTPVMNMSDEVVCYAECEITMERIFMNKSIFMIKLFVIFTLACILFSLMAYMFLLKRVISPIERISSNMKRFANGNKKSEAVCDELIKIKAEKNQEIDLLRNDAVKLIRDVGKKASVVDEFCNDIIRNMSEFVNKRLTNDTSNTDKVEQYTRLILETLRKKRKYKKLITDSYMNSVLGGVPLYDVGEVIVSDNILNKDGRLTDDEYEALKNHTRRGKEIIKDTIKGMQSEEAVEIAEQMALSHHEHYDGSGYPDGLKGNAIPFPARIIAVPDVFNALISNKSYRKAKSIDEAFDAIKQGSGKIFDKDVVNAFLKNKRDVEMIARMYMKDFDKE